MKKILLSFFVFTILLPGCSSDDGGNGTPGSSGDTFDRKAMLENIADNIIIPAYQNFSTDMNALGNAVSDFTDTATEENLVKLRSAWAKAYISWQFVNMYEIGKAEEIAYRNFMNVFPVNVTDINANLNSGVYDLTAVSKQDEQGFGALDYLINGLADTDADIVGFYTNIDGIKYKNYLSDITGRMNMLTATVFVDWRNGYRDTFVTNSGSSATSSVDKLVNDYLFHYEKHFRAGKIGIPAGQFSAGSDTFPDRVEAFYKGDFSKELFIANLNAMKDLFNGKHFGSATTGESLKSYLDFLNTIKNGEDLATLINNQFIAARISALALNEDFSSQVKSNNDLMLSTFEELQKNVVLLKVDMLQALSINIDYVDADGD